MIDEKKYEHLQKSRKAIEVINKRLFPIAEFPLIDKFIIDLLIKRRKITDVFPQWTSFNHIPIGLSVIFLYVLLLSISINYMSIIAIGVVSLGCFFGYRAKWLLDRFEVLSNHVITKKAILVAATGLTPAKIFDPVYDEDFLKPVLIDYLTGKKITSGLFINMYAELTHALNPSQKEIESLKKDFDNLIRQSPWLINAESILNSDDNKTKMFSRKEGTEFITKNMTFSNNAIFAKDDEIIESSLAILLNDNDIDDSICDQAQSASDNFSKLLEGNDELFQKRTLSSQNRDRDLEQSQEKTKTNINSNKNISNLIENLFSNKELNKKDITHKAPDSNQKEEINNKNKRPTPPLAIAISKTPVLENIETENTFNKSNFTAPIALGLSGTAVMAEQLFINNNNDALESDITMPEINSNSESILSDAFGTEIDDEYDFDPVFGDEDDLDEDINTDEEEYDFDSDDELDRLLKDET